MTYPTATPPGHSRTDALALQLVVLMRFAAGQPRSPLHRAKHAPKRPAFSVVI